MSGSNSSAPASLPRAEPLQFAVHSLPRPEAPMAQRTRLGRAKMLVVMAVCAAPVVASYFTYFVLRPQARSNYGELIEPQRPLPDALTLHDLDGRAVQAGSLKGQWLIVAVGGGACDSACERQLYMQRQLREMLGKERDRLDKLWLVTDDAPLKPALRDALEHAPAMQVLRVPQVQLAQWLAPAHGYALEQHLYIVDPLGHWMMREPAEPDPSKIKRDLEKLLRASASWDRPGR
jgi:hypothetical protein